MDIKFLEDRIANKVATLQVVGRENGDLFLVCKQGQTESIVTNSSNDEVKIFREPKTVGLYLRKHGVKNYDIDLRDWGLHNIFDRHKAASELRAM